MLIIQIMYLSTNISYDTYKNKLFLKQKLMTQKSENLLATYVVGFGGRILTRRGNYRSEK